MPPPSPSLDTRPRGRGEKWSDSGVFGGAASSGAEKQTAVSSDASIFGLDSGMYGGATDSGFCGIQGNQQLNQQLCFGHVGVSTLQLGGQHRRARSKTPLLLLQSASSLGSLAPLVPYNLSFIREPELAI